VLTWKEPSLNKQKRQPSIFAYDKMVSLYHIPETVTSSNETNVNSLLVQQSF